MKARDAVAAGIVGLDPGWRSLALKQDFFASLAAQDILAALSGHAGPFPTIAGSEDDAAICPARFLTADGGESQAVLVIDGADHIFHLIDPARSSAARGIGETVARFAATL